MSLYLGFTCTSVVQLREGNEITSELLSVVPDAPLSGLHRIPTARDAFLHAPAFDVAF